MAGRIQARVPRVNPVVRDMMEVSRNIQNIRYKITVLSGKGGVGKSMVSANMAAALALKGYKVGLLDADLQGPSIPKMMGVRGIKPLVKRVSEKKEEYRILPIEGPLGIRIISMDPLLPSDDTPVIWRNPIRHKAIKDFLSSVEWGSLDFLIIDLPPGTGDEPLSVAQLIPGTRGGVIVTIPSEVSQLVVKKAVGFAKRLDIRVLGIVENMSSFVCPKCGTEYHIFGTGGGRRIAEEMGVPFLGEIPLDPRIAESGDKGVPFVVEHEDTIAARRLMEIAEKVARAAEEALG